MAERIVDHILPAPGEHSLASVPCSLPSNAATEGAVDYSLRSVPDKHIWFEALKSDKLNITSSAYHPASSLTHEGVPRRIKCVACQICIPEHSKPHLALSCKPTYRLYPQTLSEIGTKHHFIEKSGIEFSCHKCRKKFSKTRSAHVCSWCHQVYHPECLSSDVRESPCMLGPHARLVLPPSWVVKLEKPPLTLTSSLPSAGMKVSHKKIGSVSSYPNDRCAISNGSPLPPDPLQTDPPCANFSIIPQVIGASNAYPLLVFVHPKSGGGQGLTILKEFMWLLNPRQVFDLTKFKPEYALQLFKGINVRVLCCGGDGTAGWVMSSMENLQLIKKPPISLLPLGTGNDLSRVSGWGASYSDEPLSQILFQVEAATVRPLDRWDIEVTPLPSPLRDPSGKDDLPVRVMSNYFSIGADAHASLEFHQFRERNKEKPQSRLKNKFIYLKTGSIDFLKRTYLSMCEHIELKCDGNDFTNHIRDNNYAALVILNIQSYGAGTDPWGTPNLRRSTLGLQKQDDGMLEVIGLKQSQISLLYVGGHGDRITQAREVYIKSTQPIPAQVDGEPCLLNPSTISISWKCSANLLVNSSAKREKDRFQGLRPPRECPFLLVLNVITLGDYNDYNMDISQLRQTAVSQGYVNCNMTDSLSFLRDQVQRILQSHLNPAPSQWCFLSLSPGDRGTFIRIHPDQEEMVSVQDLPSDALYVLKLECVRSVSGTLSLLSGIDIVQDQEHELDTVQHGDEAEITLIVPPDAPTEANREATNAEVPTESAVGEGNGSSSDLSLKSKAELEVLLFKASSEGDLKRVIEIQACEVNLYCKDTQNRTPLHITTSMGHRQVAQFLIDNYPSIALDIQDNMLSESALHIAASLGNRSICKMLIKANSSLLLLDSVGRTPYQRSKKCNDFSLETYLWKHEQHQRSNKLEFSI